MASGDERLEKGKIFCRTIIEMMGAPKEHIENTLKEYINGLKKDEGIEIIKVEYSPAEEQDKFWSAFAEIELWFKDINRMMQFCFHSMPSSIEILEPSELNFESNVFSGIMNDLVARLHEVDMTVKQLRAQNILMDKNSRAIVGNMIILLLEQGMDDIDKISKRAGLPKDFLEQIIKKMIEGKKIEEKEGKFIILKK